MSDPSKIFSTSSGVGLYVLTNPRDKPFEEQNLKGGQNSPLNGATLALFLALPLMDIHDPEPQSC
jgi:hypothetical protein